MTCCCRSRDRFRCIDLRYRRVCDDDAGDDDLADNEEGCQCACHDEYEDEDEENGARY